MYCHHPNPSLFLSKLTWYTWIQKFKAKYLSNKRISKYERLTSFSACFWFGFFSILAFLQRITDYLQVWTKNARHYNHLCTYTDASCNIVSVTWDNVIFCVLFSCSIVSPTTLLLNQQLAEFKRVMAFLLLLALRSDYVSLWQSMAG